MILPIISTLLTFAAGLLAGQAVVGVWDKVAHRFVADLLPMLVSLSIDRSRIRTYLRGWGFSLVASFVLFTFVLRMLPIAGAVVLLVFFAPRWILEWVIARRRTLLRDQMVGGTVALANACRAGLSLAQGLESVSLEAPQPLAAELRQIVSEYQLGRPLAEAISDARERLQLDSFTLFSSAILVSLERGGRVTEALELISYSLQENQRVERKLEAETASGKKVVWILAAFPFLFLAGFYLMHPTGTLLVFQSLIGQFVLLFVIALICASVWWSRRILAIEL
jgi:tight adherence protein B